MSTDSYTHTPDGEAQVCKSNLEDERLIILAMIIVIIPVICRGDIEQVALF